MRSYRSGFREGGRRRACGPVCAILAILTHGAAQVYAQQTMKVMDEIKIMNGISQAEVTIGGRAELHLTDAVRPISNSRVDLSSGDAWLFLEGISPSNVGEGILAQISVAGERAAAGENLRVVQYGTGSVLIPHSRDYRPLEVFGERALKGPSVKIGIYEDCERARTLRPLHKKAGSFRLKRGYMAALASRKKGQGFSRIYAAQDADLEIHELPDGLLNRLRFVRVVPWRWTGKKGWSGARVNELDLDWNYDWDNAAASSPDTEYVPMRHNRNWNAYEHINEKKGSTHALGFNEPDKSDQAHMTVEEALAQWPRLLESGLRLGSPAPSDGGLSWLYEFLDRADGLGYRVDFIAVHFYKGGWSAGQYRRWLEGIHRRTGRPIWITEFNNGANWTPPEPTREENAVRIREFVEMLDSLEFVERYAIYNWVGKGRELVSNFKPVELTKAGCWYRDHKAPLAYRDPGPPPAAPSDLRAKSLSSMSIELAWRDASDNEGGFRIERGTGKAAMRLAAVLPAGASRYVDENLASNRQYAYRIRSFNANGESGKKVEIRVRTPPGVGVVPAEESRVRWVDSEETEAADNAGIRAADGSAGTFWHTRWTGGAVPHPHEILIDLGARRRIHGVLYMPRRDGNPNGTIGAYRIYVSESRRKRGVLAASGEWTAGTSALKAEFPPLSGRYLRLVADSEINGGPWTSIAELRVLAE